MVRERAPYNRSRIGRREGVLYERGWTWPEVLGYVVIGSAFVVANLWLAAQLWR
jgi:hypothetical protein